MVLDFGDNTPTIRTKRDAQAFETRMADLFSMAAIQEKKLVLMTSFIANRTFLNHLFSTRRNISPYSWKIKILSI